jgi:hypothetical protein
VIDSIPSKFIFSAGVTSPPAGVTSLHKFGHGISNRKEKEQYEKEQYENDQY